MAQLVRIRTRGNLNRMKETLGRLIQLKECALDIGFFPDAMYENGTPVAAVAYYNEYGAGNPPRPFMRKTAERCMKKWGDGFTASLKRAGTTRRGVISAMHAVGLTAQGDVKRAIADWPPGGNQPSTVARKARRARNGKETVGINPQRTLIDTGKMIGSVSYEIYSRGGKIDG